MRGLLVVGIVALTLGGSSVDGVAGTYAHRIDAPDEVLAGDPEMPSASGPVSDERCREARGGIYVAPVNAPDVALEGGFEYPGAARYVRVKSEAAECPGGGAEVKMGGGLKMAFVWDLLRLLGWSL